MTFSQMRCLDVVNVCDGRMLGKPIDIVFRTSGAIPGEQAVVEAIIVPAPGGLWHLVRAEREGYVVPWQRIRRIGDDVILVDLPQDFFG